MSKRKGEYTLLITGQPVDKYDKKGNATFKPEETITSRFDDLSDAFNALMQFDNRHFDRKILQSQKLLLFIEKAAIISPESEIILVKRNVEQIYGSLLRPGIYIELNTQKIPQADFERQTGFELTNFIKKGPELDYFLIIPATELTKSLPTERKNISNTGRKILPDKDKGQSL